jgi:hypothetical protein
MRWRGGSGGVGIVVRRGALSSKGFGGAKDHFKTLKYRYCLSLDPQPQNQLLRVPVEFKPFIPHPSAVCWVVLGYVAPCHPADVLLRRHITSPPESTILITPRFVPPPLIPTTTGGGLVAGGATRRRRAAGCWRVGRPDVHGQRPGGWWGYPMTTSGAGLHSFPSSLPDEPAGDILKARRQICRFDAIFVRSSGT